MLDFDLDTLSATLLFWRVPASQGEEEESALSWAGLRRGGDGAGGGGGEEGTRVEWRDSDSVTLLKEVTT